MNLSDLKLKLTDQEWRINNLYKIIDKNGKEIRFKMNIEQKRLYDVIKAHNRIIIIKGRQLGFSTFIGLLALDECIWKNNKSCALIADAEVNSKNLFNNKIRAVYTRFVREFPSLAIGAGIVENNSMNMKLETGSSMMAANRLRSGTFSFLHVSELAKTAVDDSNKYTELLQGGFPCVSLEGKIIIETTYLGGKSSPFYNLINVALNNKSSNIIDKNSWYLHFENWLSCIDYQLITEEIPSREILDYFKELSFKNIVTTKEQISWYNNTWKTLKERTFLEYPTTLDEVFWQSSDGAIYDKELIRLKEQNRLTKIYPNAHQRIYAALDIGMSDATSLFVFQVFNNYIYFLDYYENSGKPIGFYIDWLSKYEIQEVFLPHDAVNRNIVNSSCVYDEFKKIFKSSVLPRTADIWGDINICRTNLETTYFNSDHCLEAVDHLISCRKRYNSSRQIFEDTMLHDQHSHCADAFRYANIAIKFGYIKSTNHNQRQVQYIKS